MPGLVSYDRGSTQAKNSNTSCQLVLWLVLVSSVLVWSHLTVRVQSWFGTGSNTKDVLGLPNRGDSCGTATTGYQRQHRHMTSGTPTKTLPPFTDEATNPQKVKTPRQGPPAGQCQIVMRRKDFIMWRWGKSGLLNSMTSINLFQLRHLCPSLEQTLPLVM